MRFGGADARSAALRREPPKEPVCVYRLAGLVVCTDVPEAERRQKTWAARSDGAPCGQARYSSRWGNIWATRPTNPSEVRATRQVPKTAHFLVIR